MRLYSWLEKMLSNIYCLCVTVQNREILTNTNRDKLLNRLISQSTGKSPFAMLHLTHKHLP